MDYKKEYVNVLMRAEEAVQKGCLDRNTFDAIFSELTESEDERMMREFNDWLCEEIECRTDDLRDEKDRRTLNMLCYILTKVKDWFEKQKESLHIPETCKEKADSFTDIKDRNIRGCIGMALADVPESRFKSYGVTLKECLAYLEKQKEQKPWKVGANAYFTPEQKPAEHKAHKAFEEWVKDYWSHNKVNNPYSYNKGDEIQFDHKGFVRFCEAYCYPQNLVLHDTFGYEEGRQVGRNEGVKSVLNEPEKYGLCKPAERSEEDSTIWLTDSKEIAARKEHVELCEKLTDFIKRSGILPALWADLFQVHPETGEVSPNPFLNPYPTLAENS